MNEFDCKKLIKYSQINIIFPKIRFFDTPFNGDRWVGGNGGLVGK